MAPSSFDAIVVGGGLAGLTAAAALAQENLSVVVLERASESGGRGTTRAQNGYLWNWGPHALYRGGDASAVLKELDVAYSGAVPNASGGFAIYDGRAETLPGGFVSLLTTGLLSVTGKIELAKLLGSLPKRDASVWDGRTVAEFVASQIRDDRVAQLYLALVRLTTYAHAPATMCAGAALRQLHLALSSNVTYIDGGWQVLVDGLCERVREGGGAIRTSARVESVECDRAVRGVRLADGSTIGAPFVVIATPPDAAAVLARRSGVGLSEVVEWATAAVPVRAACLDLALVSLPRTRNLFALGIDRPYYFSVHSAYATLAPAGAAIVHVAKYLAPSESGVDARAELEGVVDLVQPGWRDLIVDARFLPSLCVTGAVVDAKRGGLRGRPGPEVPGCSGLYVAGDWVGSAGMLADAAVASGHAAAGLIVDKVRAGAVHAA